MHVSTVDQNINHTRSAPFRKLSQSLLFSLPHLGFLFLSHNPYVGIIDHRKLGLLGLKLWIRGSFLFHFFNSRVQLLWLIWFLSLFQGYERVSYSVLKTLRRVSLLILFVTVCTGFSALQLFIHVAEPPYSVLWKSRLIARLIALRE